MSKPPEKSSSSQTPAARQGSKAARTATMGLVAALGLAAIGGGISYWMTEANNYIGTVDGHRIAKGEYDRELAARQQQFAGRFGVALDSPQGQQMLAGAKKQIVDSLVDRQILLDAAAARHLTVSDAEVDAHLSALKAQFPDPQTFANALTQNGFTEDSLRQNMRQGAIIQKLREAVTADATVSAADAKAYYDRNLKQFSVPEQVSASHILVKTLNEAQSIEAKLKAGADFGALAKQYSIDPGSKNRGGDLGFFPKGRMVPEFEKAAFALKEGQISPPVKTQFGFHIIKGGKHEAAHMQSFADVRQDIVDQLLKTKQDAEFQAWITKQRAAATVVIRPQFEPASPPPLAPAITPESGKPAAAPSAAEVPAGKPAVGATAAPATR